MLLTSTVLSYFPVPAQKIVHRIKVSPLGYRLVQGAFWSLFGAVITQCLGLISFVIVARILGKASYGEFGIIQSTVGMFGVFAGFGLGQTATKYVAELRNTDPVRAGKIMGMSSLVAMFTGIVMAVMLFTFAPWLAARTLADLALTPLLRIASIIIILEAMNGAQLGALSGFEAFRTTAKISIWVGLASFPCMMTGVYLGGLDGCVWGLTCNRAINWLLNHIALRREASLAGIPFVLRGSRKEMSILWHYSLPSMLGGVMVVPTLWICNAMLVNQPHGYEQMGIFQAAGSFQQILFFLGNTLSAPLLPMLANMLGSGKHNDRFVRINMLSTWFLGAVPAVFLFAVPELAQVIYGKEFAGRDFINTFVLTIFCSSVIIYKQGLARVLSAHGLMWWGMFSNLIWTATLIGGTWLLISWGAVGYAAAWAMAYSLNTIIFIPLYSYKKLVPMGTIVSPEAGVIWLLLFVGMSLVFLQVPLVWRLAAIPITVAGMCWSFWRLLRTRGHATP